MTQKKFSAARIMKYVVCVLIVVFVVLLMLYASGSSRPFEEVRQAVESSLDTSNLTEKDAAAFKRNFGLNAAD